MSAPQRWDQTHHYRSAADTTIRPGGPTVYTPPRPLGRSPDDFTSFHPAQATWSCNNIPDLFYALLPPPGWKEFSKSPKPGPILDQNGDIVYEKWPEEGKKARPLLDFKVLPMQLCTNDHWWYFWVIKRYDPRIRWKDITMRMKGPNRPKANSLQMMASRRWAKACNILNWQTKGHEELQRAKENKLKARLSQQQIDDNTTRGLTPGLINPAMGEAGGRIPYPSITAVHAGRRSEFGLSPVLSSGNTPINTLGKLQRTSTRQTSPTTSARQFSPTTFTGTVEQDRDMANKRKYDSSYDSSDDGYYEIDEDYVPDDVQTSKSASKTSTSKTSTSKTSTSKTSTSKSSTSKSSTNKMSTNKMSTNKMSSSKQSDSKDREGKKKDERGSSNISNPPARESAWTLPPFPRHIAARPFPGVGNIIASDFDVATGRPSLNVQSRNSHRPTSQAEEVPEDTIVVGVPRASRIRSTYSQAEAPNERMIISGPRTNRIRSTWNPDDDLDDAIIVGGPRTSRIRSTYNNPSAGRSMTTNHTFNTFGRLNSTAPQSTYHRPGASGHPGFGNSLAYVPPLPSEIPSITPGTNAYAILNPSLIPQDQRPANYQPPNQVNQQPSHSAPVVPSMARSANPPRGQPRLPSPLLAPRPAPLPAPVAPPRHTQMPQATNRANQQTTRVIPPLHTYMGPAAMRRNPQPTGPRMRASPYGTVNPTLFQGALHGSLHASQAVINPRAIHNLSMRPRPLTMPNPGINLHPHPSHLSYQTPQVTTAQGTQPPAADPQAAPEANQQTAGRRVILPSTYPEDMYCQDDWTPFGPSSIQKRQNNYPDSDGAGSGSNEEEEE